MEKMKIEVSNNFKYIRIDDKNSQLITCWDFKVLDELKKVLKLIKNESKWTQTK